MENPKIILLALILGASCLVGSNAEFKRFKHKPKHDDESLNFLVIGDWGRKGFYNQSLVAHRMGNIAEKLDIDFVISAGDNFYDRGLTGVDDLAFDDSFTNVYTASSLQTQWYSVLGNHDYRGDTRAQLSKELRQKDKRWLCMRSFMLDAGTVDFFFIDTTPFVDYYFLNPKENTYDWRDIYPRRKYLSTMLGDLSLALKNSDAKWKIVVGHHTIKSGCIHGVTGELAVHVVPILREHKVDFYINGHDHCLERITSMDRKLDSVQIPMQTDDEEDKMSVDQDKDSDDDVVIIGWRNVSPKPPWDKWRNGRLRPRATLMKTKTQAPLLTKHTRNEGSSSKGKRWRHSWGSRQPKEDFQAKDTYPTQGTFKRKAWTHSWGSTQPKRRMKATKEAQDHEVAAQHIQGVHGVPNKPMDQGHAASPLR